MLRVEARHHTTTRASWVMAVIHCHRPNIYYCSKSSVCPVPLAQRGMVIQASYRLFNCARCHRQVQICSHCDLPDNPFPVDGKKEVSVGKIPYVRFDLNDYSIPYQLTRRILVVMADEKTVRVLEGNKVVVEHKRSYDKGQQIEDPAHIEELIQ